MFYLHYTFLYSVFTLPNSAYDLSKHAFFGLEVLSNVIICICICSTNKMI